MKPNEKNAVSIVQSHFHVVQVACVIIPQMVVGGVFGVCEMMSSGNTYIIQIWYKECLAVRLEPLSSPRNDSFPAPAGPQQIVSSSVLDGSQASQPHCSVFQTNNNRFYCWPCQYPLLLLWERGVGLAPFCCLTQTACAYLTSCLVAGSNWNPDSTLFFFYWSLSSIIPPQPPTLYENHLSENHLSFLSPPPEPRSVTWTSPSSWISKDSCVKRPLPTTTRCVKSNRWGGDFGAPLSTTPEHQRETETLPWPQTIWEGRREKERKKTTGQRPSRGGPTDNIAIVIQWRQEVTDADC